MSIFGTRRMAKNRRFDYTPRYYEPSSEQIRRKRSIRFHSKTRRGRQPSFIAVALLLLLALYIYTSL
jgi:hypothetical protein